MGDSLIVRRGGSGSSQYELKTEIIQTNKTWTVPKARDQVFSIRLFGGGGCGSFTAGKFPSGGGGSGGGGGYMNTTILALIPGEQIHITIGSGGSAYLRSMNGGTTSFGTYLAANGGQSGDIRYYRTNGGGWRWRLYVL